MALIIEDGTIVSGAQSYASYGDLVEYAALYGDTLPATEAECEVLLMDAMQSLYGRNWKGSRVSADQDLEWPRTGVYRDGILLPSDEIPRELTDGQMALAIASQDTDLLPTQAVGEKGAILEERVEGAVTVKYADTGSSSRYMAYVGQAEALLAALIDGVGAGVFLRRV